MSAGSTPKLSARTLEAEQARLARFFETINKHSKALEAQQGSRPRNCRKLRRDAGPY